MIILATLDEKNGKTIAPSIRTNQTPNRNQESLVSLFLFNSSLFSIKELNINWLLRLTSKNKTIYPTAETTSPKLLPTHFVKIGSSDKKNRNSRLGQINRVLPAIAFLRVF
ncbi:hypothetical protein Gferi_07970 [Geosporobacter ferrireducens]|uniref:Uncharacterized protein n=1 Tax=Geosporobacter ferrireducens TaxID=1424294 RepID=A0A1D8GF33_9FIRM|nr:hypothetical protein Gferi_07970 [Geosporobacter ferrireducens]